MQCHKGELLDLFFACMCHGYIVNFEQNQDCVHTKSHGTITGQDIHFLTSIGKCCPVFEDKAACGHVWIDVMLTLVKVGGSPVCVI